MMSRPSQCLPRAANTASIWLSSATSQGKHSSGREPQPLANSSTRPLSLSFW